MNILVTGGTVFASRYTAEYFIKKGHNVYVLNRGSRPQSKGVIHLCGDRHNAESLLKGRHFDAVIDVTAYNETDVNDLIGALDSFGTYILISSSAVYPETLPQPFKESYETGENSIWGAYGTNKIAAEKAAVSKVPDAYIIRPPYLYGPMNNLFREAFVFECAEKDRPFYVPKDGSLPLQFFHINDLCRLIETIIAQKPKQHIINTGSKPVSVLEWVKLCYDAVGKEPELRYVTDDTPQRSYFPFYDYAYELDLTAMSSILNDLTPLDKGLAESYEWFRNNRELIIRKPLHEFIEANF